MYYYLNLKMNKGVGYMPTQEDIKSLPAEKQNIDYIKSCMVFNLNNDNDILPIEDFKIVGDGLDNLSLNDGQISGKPNVIVWLKLAEEVDVEEADNWSDALISSYKLEIPEINSEDPYYFEDQNNSSQVHNSEWLADDFFDKLQELLQELADNDNSFLANGTKLEKVTLQEEDSIKVFFQFELNEQKFECGFTFETQEELTDFNYTDKYFKDDLGSEYIEEQPYFWFINEAFLED